MINLAAARAAVIEMLAAELGCEPAALRDGDVHVVERPADLATRAGARRYPVQEPALAAASLGRGAVVSASPSLLDAVRATFDGADRDQVFEPGRLVRAVAMMEPLGLTVYGPHHRLVCGVDTLRAYPAPANCSVTVEAAPSEERLEGLRPGRWPHALSPRRRQAQEAIAVATAGGEVVGLAACSADTERLWQIGIDVAPASQSRGVGAALTAALAAHILRAGAVPWYGVAAANMASLNTAVAAGFRHAWVEAFTGQAGRRDPQPT